MSKLPFLGLVLLILFSAVNCHYFSSQKREIKRAELLIQDQKFLEALEVLESALQRNYSSNDAEKIVRLAARVAFFEVKDFERAIKFYRLLLIKTGEPAEREDCQKKIVALLYDKLKNYAETIKEVSLLLALELSEEEVFSYRMILAKSYFQLNKFYQAKTEVDILMSGKLSDDQLFQALLFKGNLYMTDKQHEAAIEVYEQLLERFTNKAIVEGVQLSLASVYEDIEKFQESIEIMEAHQTIGANAEFVEFKIKKLKERMKNLPGARGLKK